MSGVVAYLNQLIEKAAHASPPPWQVYETTEHLDRGPREYRFVGFDGKEIPDEDSTDLSPENAEFIAAADPQVVAALARIALAAEDGYHADTHGHGHFYDPLRKRPDCDTCVSLAELSRVVDQQSRT